MARVIEIIAYWFNIRNVDKVSDFVSAPFWGVNNIEFLTFVRTNF